MAKKYTYSRMIVTNEGSETFTASEFDSFDEAQRAVEKGIHDRKLQLAEKYPLGALGTLPRTVGGPNATPAPYKPGPGESTALNAPGAPASDNGGNASTSNPPANVPPATGGQ